MTYDRKIWEECQKNQIDYFIASFILRDLCKTVVFQSAL